MRPCACPPAARVHIDALKVAEAKFVEERARLIAVLDQLPISVVLAAAPPSGTLLLVNKQTAIVWRQPPGRAEEVRNVPVPSILDDSYYTGITGYVAGI
jgi:hypothetical protein